jgi:hypothetical protein
MRVTYTDPGTGRGPAATLWEGHTWPCKLTISSLTNLDCLRGFLPMTDAEQYWDCDKLHNH